MNNLGMWVRFEDVAKPFILCVSAVCFFPVVLSKNETSVPHECGIEAAEPDAASVSNVIPQGRKPF